MREALARWMYGTDKGPAWEDEAEDYKDVFREDAQEIAATICEVLGVTEETVRWFRTQCFFQSNGVGCEREDYGPCLYCKNADRFAALLEVAKQ